MLSERAVLKENELYLVGDAHYRLRGQSEGGLYRLDTRYLCRYEWSLDAQPPQLLSQHLPAPYRVVQHLSNHDVGYTMHVGLERELLLDAGGLYDSLKVVSYDGQPHTLSLRLEADFIDMFEVRGWNTPFERQVTVQPLEGGAEFSYLAQDGRRCRTRVTASLPAQWTPGEEGGGTLSWAVAGHLNLTVWTQALEGDEAPGVRPLDEVRAGLAASYAGWTAPALLADPRDQRVLDVSLQDLRSLLFETDAGPFPAAGIPWYVAPFGRDPLIMAHMLVSARPEVGLAVARYLAARQGTRVDPETLEEPGKILHEERFGELSRTGRTLFRPYYGTADATPLFVWLVGELSRSHPEIAAELRPHWEAALGWMQGPGDPDGDGLIEYTPHPAGHRNQIWKDSGDSTFDEYGVDPDGPIAVVEVQGYAYAAWLAAERLAQLVGDRSGAAQYAEQARRLRETFQRLFWWPEERYYYHGLDGDKRPLRVLVSNPAHTLWTGIIAPEYAPDVARVALSERLYTGWGLRTLAVGQPRYNPVSYHNGSVWPHDTALFALGLERYGLLPEAQGVARDLYDAAISAQDGRLAELFAGYPRGEGPPVPYPAACHPQGWDAAIPVALAHLLRPAPQPEQATAAGLSRGR